MSASPDLLETLRQAQRFGFFGDRPIAEAVAHAQEFVVAIGPLTPGSRLLDLGSGGGLPGLVVADASPEVSIVLLDRRQKRTDFLERAVRRLGYAHAEVWCRDADDVVAQIAGGDMEPFDVVTARGFGPPAVTLRTAAACVGPHGTVIISEPPSGDRWDPDLLDELHLRLDRRGAVACFTPRS